MSAPLLPTVADPASEPAKNAVQPEPTVQPPLVDDVEAAEEYDSTYEDDNASSTASISSTICDYRKVHGRTFHNHGDTEYWGPNDEAANDFLDIGHHMFTLLLDNKLYLAPLKKDVQKVLDIGTGTGIWAMDFADEFPSAAVIGIDLSPTQPGWVPPNLRFEICDIQLEWTYPADSFDFIHLRTMGGSIDNWPLLYSRAFAATKPGGWFEQIDTDIQICCDDGSVPEDSVLFEWSRLFIGAGESMGRSFTIIRDAKKLLEEAGFVDVVEVKYKIPIGPWGKDPTHKALGRWYLLYITTGLESMALYMLTSVLGWEYAEVQVFLAKMRAAIKNPKLHSYTNHTVVYGRKPEAA